MACCCVNILELCKVAVCGGEGLIKLGAVAPEAGNFKLVLEYLGVDLAIYATFSQGEDMNFPATELNEDYKYQGKLLGPTLDPVTITVGDIVYDCISFQTVLEYELNEPPENPE